MLCACSLAVFAPLLVAALEALAEAAASAASVPFFAEASGVLVVLAEALLSASCGKASA